MGGYRSGRKRTHTLTSGLLQVDIKDLKAYLADPDGCAATLSYGQQSVSMALMTQEDTGMMLFTYIARTPDQRSQEIVIHISLVTTPCHYGGQRWWLQAPCCGSRVRVLYFGVFLHPACRSCCQLHYQSQMASHIERHIAREKYLLANYGYEWAAHEYDGMSEHYFTVTPEYAHKKRRSRVIMQFRMIRKLMSWNKLMYRRHISQFGTIRSAEDRRIVLDAYRKGLGRPHVLSLLMYFRSTYHRYASAQELDDLILFHLGIAQEKNPATILSFQDLKAIHQELKKELDAMGQAAA